MPKAIETDDILMALYRYRHIDEESEERTPLKYAEFRKIMITSNVIMSESTIRTRYDQLIFSGYADVMPGKVKQCLLDNIMVFNDLIRSGRISGKIRRRVQNTVEYTLNIHKNEEHTHTRALNKEGSQ